MLDAEDEQSYEDLRAEAGAAGIDFDAWAGRLRAKAGAYRAAERRAGANDVAPLAPAARRGKARLPLVMALATAGVAGLATVVVQLATSREAPLARKYLQRGVTEESAPWAAVARPSASAAKLGAPPRRGGR